MTLPMPTEDDQLSMCQLTTAATTLELKCILSQRSPKREPKRGRRPPPLKQQRSERTYKRTTSNMIRKRFRFLALFIEFIAATLSCICRRYQRLRQPGPSSSVQAYVSKKRKNFTYASAKRRSPPSLLFFCLKDTQELQAPDLPFDHGSNNNVARYRCQT